MRESNRRLRDWTDRVDLGTHTIQTSGNLWLTGSSIGVQDYTLHSYQVVPIGDAAYAGALRIEVSNDSVNWTKLADYTWDTKTGAQLVYSDTWSFAYARPVVTGTDSNEYLINERHFQ